jgi:hypothetical protein
MRERDIRNAIRSALVATDAFDDGGVVLWGFRDASDQGADRTRAVSILPGPGKEDDKWDGVLDGQMLEMDHARLIIRVRDEDIQKRDEDADRLLNICKDALNGAALNTVLGEPVIYPQWTKIISWDWREPTPPQREIECVFQYLFDAPTWTGFDTSE